MTKVADVTLKINGMHCASCVNNIERTISQLDGVAECQVNLATSTARVSYDADSIETAGIINRVAELGYGASLGGADIITAGFQEEKTARHHFVVALILTAPLMVIAMWPAFGGKQIYSLSGDALAQAIIAGIVLLYAGRSILVDAWRQTIHVRANMNSLIALGTVTAYLWSLFGLFRIYNGQKELLYFESAGMIITLILLGRYLEVRTKGKAGQAIEALYRLRPAETTAIINDVEVRIDPSAARTGMTLLVKPGERVSADGEILEGSPLIDESMLTGESFPVEKAPGHGVLGGSLNGNTPFKMTVTATGEESFLASVVRLVSEAQARKAPIQQLADRVAGIFVPVVIGIALITAAFWLWLAPDSPLLIRSVISVLIVACPCALGLATPTAVLSGTARAASEGIIIRGGDILEGLATVDMVIFDKTGTLTHGELEVVRIRSFGKLSEQNLVRLLGSLEAQSEHPVGEAIVRYMKGRQIEPTVVKNAVAKPGFGMIGDFDGSRLAIGNRSLMESEDVSFGPSLVPGEVEMEKGRTVVYAAVDGDIVGMISLADRVKGDARELVGLLEAEGRSVTMITGDSRQTAGGVAHSLGLDRYEAEVRPEQKRLIVESYRKAGFKVAMVGDGVNDAPALAEANVGVAIGTGADVALETADVVLVRDDLNVIHKMFSLAQQSLKVIKQNLFWAFFYNVIAITVASGLFYPVFGLTLSPMVAAAAMTFSSLFVVSNSLRLNKAEL